MKFAEAYVDVRANLLLLQRDFAKARTIAATSGRSISTAFKRAALADVSGLGRMVGDAFKGVSSAFKRGAAVVGAGAVAGGAGAFGLLKLASNAEEMGSKFNVVFAEMRDNADAWAGEMAKTMGRSKIDLKGYMAALQDTFVPLGFDRGAAAEMTKTVTQLGVDLASFNDMADQEAIDRLVGGLVGNHENFRRFGVIVTQSVLDAELLAMGYKKVADGATEQQKALARLNVLLRQTTDAHGDAVRTQGSFANQLKGLLGMSKDFGASAGAQLLPFATKFTALIKQGIPALQQFLVTNRQTIETWGMVALKIGAAVAAIGGFFTVIGALATPLGVLVALLGLAVGGFMAMGGTAGELDSMLSDWGAGFLEAVDSAIAKIQEFQDGLAQMIVDDRKLTERFGFVFDQGKLGGKKKDDPVGWWDANEAQGAVNRQTPMERYRLYSERYDAEKAAGKQLPPGGKLTFAEWEAKDQHFGGPAATVKDELTEGQMRAAEMRKRRGTLTSRLAELKEKFKFEIPQNLNIPGLPKPGGSKEQLPNPFADIRGAARFSTADFGFGLGIGGGASATGPMADPFSPGAMAQARANRSREELFREARLKRRKEQYMFGPADAVLKKTSSAAGFAGVAELSKSIQASLAPKQDKTEKLQEKIADAAASSSNWLAKIESNTKGGAKFGSGDA